MLDNIKNLIRKKRETANGGVSNKNGGNATLGDSMMSDSITQKANSGSNPNTKSASPSKIYDADENAGGAATTPAITLTQDPDNGDTKLAENDSNIPDRIDSRFQSYYSELSSRYIIVEQIGEGAFSKVFKSYDTHLKKFVAIKIIDKTNLNVQQINSILKEIAIMSKINHENVVKLYSYKNSTSSRYCFLILEYVEGGEIFNKIIKYTYFSEDLSRHIIRQVVKSVKYLHDEAGIVHRDIKPENLLFTPINFTPNSAEEQLKHRRKSDDNNKLDEGKFIKGYGAAGVGVVKIADFGLSKVLWDNSTNTPCGTVGYTAPEIIKDEYYSKKVDVWAIGCVLYTLLCGFPPFYDTDPKILAKKVSKGDYCFLSPWWDEISQGAKNLVSNLLTIDPDKRYTIDQILNDPWFNKNYEDEAKNNLKVSNAAADAPPATTFDKDLFYKFNNTTTENVMDPSEQAYNLGSPLDELLTPRAEAIRLVFDTGNIIQRESSPISNPSNALQIPLSDNSSKLGKFKIIQEEDEGSSLLDIINNGKKTKRRSLSRRKIASPLGQAFVINESTPTRRRGSSIKKLNKDEVFDYESSEDGEISSDSDTDTDSSDLEFASSIADSDEADDDDSVDGSDSDDDDDDDDDDDEEDDDSETNSNFEIKKFIPRSIHSSSKLSKSPYLNKSVLKSKNYRISTVEDDIETETRIRVSSSPKPASIMNKQPDFIHIEDTDLVPGERRKSSIPFITPVTSEQTNSTNVSSTATNTTGSTNSRCDSLSSKTYQSSRCSSMNSNNHNLHSTSFKTAATLATSCQNHNDINSPIFNKIEESVAFNTSSLSINSTVGQTRSRKSSVSMYPRTPHIPKDDILGTRSEPYEDDYYMDESDDDLANTTPVVVSTDISSNINLLSIDGHMISASATPTPLGPTQRPKNTKADSIYQYTQQVDEQLNALSCGKLSLSSTANSKFDLNLNSSTMLLRRKLKNDDNTVVLEVEQ